MIVEYFLLRGVREAEIFDLVWQWNLQDWKSECKISCTRSKYTARFLSKLDYWTGLNIFFDTTVDVTRSTFNIGGQTLLTNLGGAVSSGRTLLWILVSLLGATQVILILIFNFPR